MKTHTMQTNQRFHVLAAITALALIIPAVPASANILYQASINTSSLIGNPAGPYRRPTGAVGAFEPVEPAIDRPDLAPLQRLDHQRVLVRAMVKLVGCDTVHFDTAISLWSARVSVTRAFSRVAAAGRFHG